jgi:predicted RNA-binding Zn-ribbon protein involved in translation (DUF1610 family)
MPSNITKDEAYEQPCNHPEHNPPGFIVIPQGHKLEHKCPACGKESIVRPIAISF